MKTRWILLLALTALLPFAGWSEVTLQLSKNEISQDDSTALRLKVVGGLKRLPPEIPLPEGLEVRNVSRQDTLADSKHVTWVVYEINASKPGTYQIGPYSLKMDDGQHELPAMTLTVTAPKVVNVDEGLFVTFEASSDQVYLKQPLDVTLTFFSEHPIEDINVTEFPTEGFEISDWQPIRSRNRSFDGKTYRVKRYVARMIPKKPGAYTFDPAFRVRIQEPGELKIGPSFGMPRRVIDIRTVRMKLPEPGTLEVLAPPAEGRPEGFTGHVGRFELSGSLSPERVTVGDPVTLRVQLTGRGSILEALPPQVEESADFNVYEPKLIAEDMRRDGLSGIKTIEQVIIPRNAGITELPKIAFSFFDPEMAEYQTTTLGPFPLEVTGGADEGDGTRVVSSLPQDTETGLNVLGEDLVYLKRSPGRLRPLDAAIPGWGVAVGTAAPLGLWGILALAGLMKQHSRKDPDLSRKRSASRDLQHDLKSVEQLEPSERFPRMWGVLSSYLQTRLELPPGDLDAASLKATLSPSLKEETLETLLHWVTQCEQARFSGEPPTLSEDRMADFRDCMLAVDQELGA